MHMKYMLESLNECVRSGSRGCRVFIGCTLTTVLILTMHVTITSIGFAPGHKIDANGYTSPLHLSKAPPQCIAAWKVKLVKFQMDMPEEPKESVRKDSRGSRERLASKSSTTQRTVFAPFASEDYPESNN